MHRLLPSALCVLALSASVHAAPDAPVYHGKVSALSVASQSLGKDWTGPTGLVIDDFDDLSNVAREARAIAEALKKQVAPLGVVAVADFTYRRQSDPLDQVTLRVFVFDTEESCRDWWRKKYRAEGWEKAYTVVEGVPYDALDSKETTKRIVALGNVWMTCGSLKKSDSHLKLLDLCLEMLRAARANERRKQQDR
jgi:hypothetical protein